MSKAVNGTENSLSNDVTVALLKAKLLATTKSKNQPAVVSANRKVLWTTISKALKYVFMDGLLGGKRKVQDLFCRFIAFVLTPPVAAGMLDMIPEIHFDKKSQSDVSINAIAYRIAGSAKFLEPIVMRELDRAAYVAKIGKPSNPHACRRSMAQPKITISDSGSDSSNE